MPLFYQHNIDDSTRIAVWKIEEPEAFFLEKVPVKKDVRHPYKRLQHLAGRYLLTQLFDDFPLDEIEIADTRKPFLPTEKYHFSISHCGNYAAAIASSTDRVGVDVELETPRLYTISHKFLNPEETAFLAGWEHLTQLHLQLTTILWSCKEAVFKWHGNGGMDFRKDVWLSGPLTFRSNELIDLPFTFNKGTEMKIQMEARIFNPLVLAWIKTPAGC